MCGRRILPPSRPDGSPHYAVDEVDAACEDFIGTFNLKAAKNYNVDILVENWLNDDPHSDTNPWDEEVEIYDIRDYITVVITGILRKSENLCRLNVRIGLAEFRWSEEEVLANTKLLLEPFERLRNVRQPRFCGVFGGKPEHNYMMRLPRPGDLTTFSPGSNNSRIPTPLCSVPLLAVHTPILRPGDSTFDVYRKTWERQISQTANCSLIEATPIRAMFSQLKDFYTKLALLVPDVERRPGRHEFLHRARVARDNDNIEAFRLIRNELIGFWYTYLEQEELRENDINAKLYGMLDADVYPSPELEQGPYPSLTTTASHVISPVLLDTDAMTAERIPMQGNTAMAADGTPNVGNLVEWREPQQLPLLTDTNQNHSARTNLTEQQMQGWEMAFVHNVSQAANEPLQTASVPSNSTMPQQVTLFPSPPQKDGDAWSGPNEPLQTAPVPSNNTMPQKVTLFPSPPQKDGEALFGQKPEAENRITLPCNDFRGAYTPACLLSGARRSPYKSPYISPYQSPYESPYITSPQASHASRAYSQHGTENRTSIGHAPPPLTNDSPGSSQGGSWLSANSFLNGLSSPEEQHWVGWEDSNGSSTQSSGFGAGPTGWNFEIDGHGAEARVFHDFTHLPEENRDAQQRT